MSKARDLQSALAFFYTSAECPCVNVLSKVELSATTLRYHLCALNPNDRIRLANLLTSLINCEIDYCEWESFANRAPAFARSPSQF